MSAATPAPALKPASTAELAEILARDARPLEPIGSGTKRGIGRPVEAELLALGALAGIVEYRPNELVLTAMASTPLAEIERRLAEQGQRLAFDPPDLGALLGAGPPKRPSNATTGSDDGSTDDGSTDDGAFGERSRNTTTGTGKGQTIGGVLAGNLSGSRRIAAGAARDHFLGVTAVNGRGETFKAGGKVVKNVTGYDLPKLLAGSWGSLAVLAEVTLKVVPAAETEQTLILPDQAPERAVAAMSAALGSAHEVSSAGFDPWRGTALRLEGFAASVAARRGALLGVLGDPEADVLEGDASRAYWSRVAGAEALAGWPVVWRISVPPTDAPRLLAAIAPERYLLDWGGGLIFAAFDHVDAARVRGALREGHAMLLKAPADAKTCRQQPPSAVLAQVLARLKAAFDPDNRLNPGRMD